MMELDPEGKNFIISDEEARRLRMHPAWQVCPLEKAKALGEYVSQLSQINLVEVASARSSRIEARRQKAVLKVANAIQSELARHVGEGVDNIVEQTEDITLTEEN